MDRIDEITRNCFNALAQLRQLEPNAPLDPMAVHGRLCSFVDAAIREAGDRGFRQEDAQEIAYPIVALADEIMSAKDESVRRVWVSRSLQLRYFNENIAGDNFFVRLDELKRDPHRVEILRVYYLCLLFGFQGKYQVRGGEVTLQNIVDELKQILLRARAMGSGEVLSPKGARPPDIASRAQRSMPIVALSMIALLLALALNIGLRVYLGAQTRGAVEQVSSAPAVPAAARPRR
jgi:type VI secretion system protein ImpK